jgi:hypothetical protein
MQNNQKQVVELADILRQHQAAFTKQYQLCTQQLKAYTAITHCRTAALGGHRYECNRCGHSAQAYNSCRNRHCNKCQFTKKNQWVDNLAANLPPTKHFHIVFTIPPCLHPVFYSNQKKAYSLLFKAAGLALRQCAANVSWLGAHFGAVAVLHTWGQQLTYHPHIHMIVPAGGLSEDASEWIPSHPKFFVDVKVLSGTFRGILINLITQAIQAKQIKIPDGTTPEILKKLCLKKNWVVYCEKPFKSPKSVIAYLGNYTHRVAISNHRILALENDKVSFRYKDYRQAAMPKTLTLQANEFIRRFMQHILPAGLSKIRYFGFLALRHLKENVDRCCQLLNKTINLSSLAGLNGIEVLQIITGIDPFNCTKCQHGRMVRRLHIEPG